MSNIKIINYVLNYFFKTKVNFIRNDLKKLQLTGSIEKISVYCSRSVNEKYSSSKESNEFDDIEQKNNYEIIFNPFGYKIQEISYRDRSKDLHDIKYFEYNSNLLIKTQKSFTKPEDHNYTAMFRYLYKKNSIEQLIYLGNKISFKNIYYHKNNYEIISIKKITYLPGNTEEKQLYFDQNGNIEKITDSFFQTQTVNKYENGVIKQSVTSIEFDIISNTAEYEYDGNNNCKKINYYSENGELFKTESFEYDNYNNWVNKIINYHRDTVYKIKRSIAYRQKTN